MKIEYSTLNFHGFHYNFINDKFIFTNIAILYSYHVQLTVAGLIANTIAKTT